MPKINKVLPYLLITLIIAITFIVWPDNTSSSRFVKVERGTFETTVTEIGNIKAAIAEEILAPHALLTEGKFLPAMEILELVPEGTLVKKGDQVAVLDPSQVITMLNEIEQRTFELQQSIEQSKLDSSLTLSSARNKIESRKEQLTDARLKVDQSIYESKSVQRQTQIALEKAQRQLKREKRNYDQKRRALKAQIQRENKYLTQFLRQVNNIKSLASHTVITAPSDGMVIYAKNFGIKTSIGSNVNGWQSTIATLPDLRHMQSVIQISETDISKIKLGQNVKIQVEAIPNTTYTGQVTKVANIGQELPNRQQIVFDVTVKINIAPSEEDFKLLPNMTSSNTIITNQWESAIYVDKRAVLNQDTISYVLKKNGLSTTKQIICIEGENMEHYRITSGLDEGDKLLIDFPADHHLIPFAQP